MIEQITEAFENSQKRSGDIIRFLPEIKVKRETDTLYISQLRKTRVSIVAMVEVHNGTVGDKAPMPLTMLNDVAQRAILIRLK